MDMHRQMQATFMVRNKLHLQIEANDIYRQKQTTSTDRSRRHLRTEPDDQQRTNSPLLTLVSYSATCTATSPPPNGTPVHNISEVPHRRREEWGGHTWSGLTPRRRSQPVLSSGKATLDTLNKFPRSVAPDFD